MTSRHVNIFAAVISLTAAAGFGWLAVASRQSPVASGEISPSLVVEPSIADLGLARQNQTLSGTYSVVNRFPVAVDIGTIMKSCSCADAEVEPRHLEPGQTATLRVVWKTGTKRGPVSDRLTVLATTVGEHPRQVIAELRLLANVQPDVVVEPAKVTFARGVHASVVITMNPGAVEGVELLQAYANSKELAVTTDVATRTVTVKYDPATSPDDSIVTMIMIETTSTSERWVQIPVTIVRPLKEQK